jgi:hypothetical protein
VGLNLAGGDADTVFHAGDIVSDGMLFYLLDSLNERILVLSKDLKPIGEMSGYSKYLGSIWIDSDYLVGGRNVVGPDKFVNTFFFDRHAMSSKPRVLVKSGVLGNYVTYAYLCHFGNILVFQDDNAPILESTLPGWLKVGQWTLCWKTF